MVIRGRVPKSAYVLLLAWQVAGVAACSDDSGDTNDASVDSSTDGRVTMGESGARDILVGDGTLVDNTIRDGVLDDSASRDASVGDARAGDAVVPDSQVEDRGVGDAAPADVRGEPPLDAETADAPIADASKSDATHGDDAGHGDASIKDIGVEDGAVGDSGAGDAAVGDGVLGDAVSSDAAVGDAPFDTSADGPRSAHASVSVHVQEYDGQTNPEHKDHVCPPGRHWVNVPYQRGRDPIQQYQQTTETDVLSWAVDGLDGDAVACTVKANGAAFDVTLDATGYAVNSNQDPISPAIVHIRIPSIANGVSNAPGTITVQDHASQVTYGSNQCVFSTLGGSMGVAEGRVWGRVHCENLTDPSWADAVCLLDNGFFVFEGCAK